MLYAIIIIIGCPTMCAAAGVDPACVCRKNMTKKTEIVLQYELQRRPLIISIPNQGRKGEGRETTAWCGKHRKNYHVVLFGHHTWKVAYHSFHKMVATPCA